ncbi:MAG: RNA degradosome polyphosphate kinase, partial [Actinomyces sp.]
MTTPDSSETPQPSRARLSAFLGGWARFQSKSGDSPDDAGSPAADDGPGVGAGAPDAADAADAGGAAPDASAASDGDRANGTADEDGTEGPADDAVAGAADDADDQAGELAELDESTELVDHIIEAADPRDFADDAGPQYEDEDFDEDIEGDGGEIGHAPTTGRADAVVAQEDEAPAPADPPAAPPSADETGAAPAEADEPPAPPRPDPEDELPPLESFADRYTDRELTWMDFNERVLEQAEDRDLPLLERAWFLAIFSSNLDEFYMVRVAGLMRRIKAGITPVRASGLDANQVLAQVTRRAKELTARQAALFQEDVRPVLAAHNVDILGWDDLDPNQQERLTRYFRHHIYPVLTPLAVDPSHPFPYISGLSLNLAVILRNPRSGKEHFARVKVPDSLPRLVTVPGRELGATDKAAGSAVIPLEVVIGRHLDHLFPGMDILEHHLFRVTRNEDLEVEEDDAENL